MGDTRAATDWQSPVETIHVVSAERLAQVVRMRPAPRVALSIPDLDLAENRRLERRINRLVHACGCDLGAKAMCSGFALTLAGVVAGWPVALPGVQGVVAVVLSTAIAAIAGKATGIVIARRRALREVHKLVGATFAISRNVERSGARS